MDKNMFGEENSLWTVIAPVTVGDAGQKKEDGRTVKGTHTYGSEMNEVHQYRYQYLYIEDEDDQKK